MAGLSSPGIGSGLDINGLVNRLMDVEKMPLTALDKKEASYHAKLTAYGSLKGALSSLQSSVKSLASPAKFTTMKGTVGDATVATVATNSIAKPASHKLEVVTLAQAQKLAAAAVPDPAAPLGTGLGDDIGTGTLTIDFGTYSGGSFVPNSSKAAKTLTIDAAHNSLNGVRDTINAAGAGVTASIVNDGSGYRLVVTGNDSGVDNSIRIVVDEDGTAGDNKDTKGLSQLAFDPAAAPGAGKNLTVMEEAKSAFFKIDGIGITKSANVVTDAIQGVTLSLLKTNDGTPTTLSVARDTSDVRSSVEGFVKAYNELAKTVKELGGYDKDTKKAGVLLGDSALRSIQEQLRTTIGQQLGTADGSRLNSLSDIGISFQRDGTLALNAAKFNGVLADPSKNVGALFATMGTTTDGMIGFVAAGTSTNVGTYGVRVDQMPMRGYAVGTKVVGATTIDDDNRTLSLSVDGTAATIMLNKGDYATPDAMVAELQARINSDGGLSAAGKKVTVSHADGKITITSATWGAASNVTITGGDSAVAALFDTTTAYAGKDVAGAIGGATASASRQILTGQGAAAGLELSVDGGIAGERGSVTYSHGIGYKLDKLLQSLLDKTGAVAGRTDGINTSVKDIATQRKTLEARLVQVEKRYRAQFNALDQMVASMQQTSSYLTQQLATLSAQTNSK